MDNASSTLIAATGVPYGDIILYAWNNALFVIGLLIGVFVALLPYIGFFLVARWILGLVWDAVAFGQGHRGRK